MSAMLLIAYVPSWWDFLYCLSRLLKAFLTWPYVADPQEGATIFFRRSFYLSLRAPVRTRQLAAISQQPAKPYIPLISGALFLAQFLKLFGKVNRKITVSAIWTAFSAILKSHGIQDSTGSWQNQSRTIGYLWSCDFLECNGRPVRKLWH